MFYKNVTLHAIFLVLVTGTMLMGTLSDISPEIKKKLPDPVGDEDYYFNGSPPELRVELGRMLFFDKILSGNRNISCATCHHPALASGDGVALPLGEGPNGLGPKRKAGYSTYEAVHERVPRNSPGLFNLGASEFTILFHDGRVELDSLGYYEGGFITPAKWKLPKGLENVLAAQAMFPVSSPAEMAGQKGENSLAEAQSLNNVAGKNGLWEQIARRLQSNPEYVAWFVKAFPNQVKEPDDITMVQVANAISAFETKEFRADQSPFDEFLRTGKGLSESQLRGLELFYGKANCFSCHSGKFQTDHDFHAIAMPQIGPGKNDGNDGSYWRETGIKAFLEDFGRGRVTFNPEDNYTFRTPSLRNVELTAPYGHAGAYQTLEGVVKHHLNPVESLENYVLPEELLPKLETVYELTANGPNLIHHEMSENRKKNFMKRDFWVQNNKLLRRKIAGANELAPIDLTDSEINDLIEFLKSLTDPNFWNMSHIVPEQVPSGLTVDQ